MVHALSSSGHSGSPAVKARTRRASRLVPTVSKRLHLETPAKGHIDISSQARAPEETRAHRSSYAHARPHHAFVQQMQTGQQRVSSSRRRSRRQKQSRAAVHDDMRRSTAEPRSTEWDWLEECLLRQCVLSSSPKTLHAATLWAPGAADDSLQRPKV